MHARHIELIPLIQGGQLWLKHDGGHYNLQIGLNSDCNDVLLRLCIYRAIVLNIQIVWGQKGQPDLEQHQHVQDEREECTSKYFKDCLEWNKAKHGAFLRLEFVLCPKQEISRVLNHVKMASRSELLTATPRWSHPLVRPGPKLATFSFERRTLTDLMFHYM